jgi:hypothetical protein
MENHCFGQCSTLTVSNRSSKGSCTLKIREDSRPLRVQQRPLNSPLNLEDDVVSSIYFNTLNNRFNKTKIYKIHLRVRQIYIYIYKFKIKYVSNIDVFV